MLFNPKWPLEQTLMNNRKLFNHLDKVPTSKIAPDYAHIFSSIDAVDPEDVKVIVIGQDPYINGEAHGLAFSSIKGMTPSLRVIFKELELEYGTIRTDPYLGDWADQGVLLLNTILTTELGHSAEHKNFGWQEFTMEIVRYVINLGNPIAVMLWGNYARNFWSDATKTMDASHIKLLSACHPQAENYGSCKFTGCNHFVKANEWLVENDLKPIKWL
jgi:uracil-DNA glycosylase